MNETELIQLLCERDEPAFRILVEQYKNRIFSTILNILQEREEAEDTTQEVFIQVFESISSFKQESLLSSWIYKIAVRKAIDKLRKRKTRSRLHQFIPWWMPNEKVSEDRTFFHPGVTLENKEKATALYNAMKTLPERQRIALTLIKIQGMNYEEACKIMDLGIKAIESLVSRGKENLEKKLQHIKEER